jgi:hypothetical protein
MGPGHEDVEVHWVIEHDDEPARIGHPSGDPVTIVSVRREEACVPESAVDPVQVLKGRAAERRALVGRSVGIDVILTRLELGTEASPPLLGFL